MMWGTPGLVGWGIADLPRFKFPSTSAAVDGWRSRKVQEIYLDTKNLPFLKGPVTFSKPSFWVSIL